MKLRGRLLLVLCSLLWVLRRQMTQGKPGENRVVICTQIFGKRDGRNIQGRYPSRLGRAAYMAWPRLTSVTERPGAHAWLDNEGSCGRASLS
jgi:hypothetical protein